MNYSELNKAIQEIALKLPNVNTYTEGDVFENWHKTVKYSAVDMGLESISFDEGCIIYNVIIYYADRANNDNSNKIGIYDDGIRILKAIVDGLDEYDISYGEDISMTPFELNFEDVLDGIYMRIRIYSEYTGGVCGII